MYLYWWTIAFNTKPQLVCHGSIQYITPAFHTLEILLVTLSMWLFSLYVLVDDGSFRKYLILMRFYDDVRYYSYFPMTSLITLGSRWPPMVLGNGDVPLV